MTTDAPGDVMRISEGYGLPVIDYEREGDALVLAVGSGMMMAVMDLFPRARWCVDLGGGQRFERMSKWLGWMNRVVPGPIVVAAWFSVTDPIAFSSALAVVDEGKLLVYSNADLHRGRRLKHLDELEAAVAAWPVMPKFAPAPAA